jgi:hypothetical protein
MKNRLTSVVAILLGLWYSLSVIGFGLHTCSRSGETYIATVASGFSCEDIHSASHVDRDCHEHSDCGCCHRHETENEELTTIPCCTNDYHVIALTGLRCVQDSDDADWCNLEMTQLHHYGAEYPGLNIHYSGLRAFYKPSSRDIVPRDVQAVYNIWRI